MKRGCWGFCPETGGLKGLWLRVLHVKPGFVKIVDKFALKHEICT